MNKQEAAFELYKVGWEQQHIAQAIGVSDKSVGGWKKKYNWDQKRTEVALSKETSEERLWALINYQLKALEKKTEEWTGNSEFRLLDKGDIDALSKMYSAVKGKQHTWAQMVELVTELMAFIESRNLELAKKIMPLTDEFLMTKKASLQ